jgi:tetratricopeptide (TPR) repeat protein
VPAAPPELRLPSSASRFAPAQTEIDGPLTGEIVTETESCAGCHADAAAQWRSSAHAFGSFNNPVYRVAVDRFREAEGNTKSRFCGACHDVALLVDGAMDGPVAPRDGRAHGGITCRVCHGIEATASDGNGSYVLASSPIPIPRDGDDESLRAHRARMAMPPLRTAAMCGTCHRSFLSEATGNKAALTGQDDLGPWERSGFAGSFAERVDAPMAAAECRTCHMPLEDAPLGDAAAKDGKIRSHRFAGGQTWLAAMRGDSAQLDAVRAMLRGAASIDVAAVVSSDGTRSLPADGAPVIAGQSLRFDVVVRSERVGHRFPGGVLDAQDTWVETRVEDAQGRTLASAGTLEESTGDDPSAHGLWALQVDDAGGPLRQRETQRFRTPVFNHTIAPRDADVVRYRFDVPPSLDPRSLPLRVTARLRHRSRSLELARAACSSARTTRSVEFVAETRERGATLDACAPEPVTEIGEAEAWIGAGWAARAAPPVLPAWRRLYDHGLGFLHGLQEDLDEARPSLERALQLTPPGGAQARAMVLYVLAQVDIREGLTGDAMDHLDEADALAPGELSIERARGQALADIWQWQSAVGPLRAASLRTPLDDSLFSQLAVALASANDPAGALDAVTRGLALSPRDADMLRVQATSLDAIGSASSDIGVARAAFAQWRPADDVPALKNRCSKRFDWCAQERIPLHVYRMR